MYWAYPAGQPLHVRIARTWLTAHLESVWDDSDAVFVAETAASEILTNASTHGSGLVTVAVHADTERLLLEVGDDSPHLPELHLAEDDDEHGRGLQIVDALAVSWRVRPRFLGGKTVQIVMASTSDT